MCIYSGSICAVGGEHSRSGFPRADHGVFAVQEAVTPHGDLHTESESQAYVFRFQRLVFFVMRSD